MVEHHEEGVPVAVVLGVFHVGMDGLRHLRARTRDADGALSRHRAPGGARMPQRAQARGGHWVAAQGSAHRWSW